MSSSLLPLNMLPVMTSMLPVRGPGGAGGHSLLPYRFTRSMYEPVAVSMRMTSPSLMKAGTWTTSPVSIFAGLPTFDTVAPLIAGSVSRTFISTVRGSSMPTGRPS